MRIYPIKFTAGDRTPYTYRITHKITGVHYYGRNAWKGSKPENFWLKYFTSSKIVKKIIAKDGVNIFEPKVMRVFSTIQDCKEHEGKFLRRVNAAKNPKMLNQSNGGKSAFGRAGTKWSEEQRAVYVRAALSKPAVTKETKLRHSLSQLGSKNHCFGKIWIKHVQQNITIQIDPKELDFYLSLGYERGRILTYSKKPGAPGTIYVSNKATSQIKRIKPEELTEYLSRGFERGIVVDRKNSKFRWVTHIITNQVRKIQDSELPDYLENGYRVGTNRVKDSVTGRFVKNQDNLSPCTRKR